MSETENNMPNASRETELTEKCRELSRMVNLLFAGLVITSFTLTAFLGLEAKRSAKLHSFRKQQAEDTMTALKQTDAHDQAILSRLVEFGRTHPDFQNKVLVKYNITANPAGGKK